MNSITKYTSISLAMLCVVTVIYCLIIRNERDNALYRVDTLNAQLDATLKSNESLNGYISILEDQAKQNDKYITDLETSRLVIEQKTTEQAEQFKHAKRNNKNITQWADVELPARLY